jgi:hypothetical protein
MTKNPVSFCSALLLAFLFHSVSMAQPPQPTPAPEKPQPIVTKWTTLEGMVYYHDGVRIKDDDSLKTVVSALNDPEANRLLDVSSTSHTAGVVLLVGGSAVLIGGAVVAVNNYNIASHSLNSSGAVGVVIALAGLVGDYIGTFKLKESQTSKYAAVQRYNVIVRGEQEEAGWNQPKPAMGAELLALKF